MTRYWAMRTDTRHNTDYLWRELRAGRLRQGWGYRPDQDLYAIGRLLLEGGQLNDHQKATWRGNRRLLPTQRDAVRLGDLIVVPHLPRYGLWTIVRVTGPYQYSIDEGRNSGGRPDFGHVLPIEFATDPIPAHDAAVSDGLRQAMRFRQRMRSMTGFESELEQLASLYGPANAPRRGG
jgi:hypothetical protein